MIGHTIKGAWRYLEHDWVSRAGGTVYETAGSARTPESCGDEETEVFFVIVGELLFLDPDGNIVARENHLTSMERYLTLLPRSRDRAPGPDRVPLRGTAMTGNVLEPSLSQVAFSVVDLAATERWFREGLGFLPAGGSRMRMRGPLASSVQGLPRVASTCWWMVGRNDFFQLEMFQFERPLARLMPHDLRPCDIGYTRIGVWVADFDGTLAGLERLGSSTAHRPGRPRRGASRVRSQSGWGVSSRSWRTTPSCGRRTERRI